MMRRYCSVTRKLFVWGLLVLPSHILWLYPCHHERRLLR
jgi:hypothetical protein